MPIESTFTITGLASATATPWVPTDIYSQPFNLAWGVAIVTGADPDRVDTYRVQHTMVNVMEVAAPSAAAIFDTTDVTAGPQSSGNIAFPVRAVRVLVSSIGTASTITVNIIQAGH